MKGQVRINIEESGKDPIQAAALIDICEKLSTLGLDVLLYSDIKVLGKELIDPELHYERFRALVESKINNTNQN